MHTYMCAYKNTRFCGSLYYQAVLSTIQTCITHSNRFNKSSRLFLEINMYSPHWFITSYQLFFYTLTYRQIEQALQKLSNTIYTVVTVPHCA